MQQPTLDYGQSTTKIAPQSRRLARDFNAPPYQGRLAPREVPPGYHYVAKHYSLNGCENPGYQPNVQRMQNQRYPEANGQHGNQFQIDQLMNQVIDMVQRQFGLKPKNIVVSYKKPYLEWFDQVLLPPRFRLPDFIKFTGTCLVSTMEHISQYLAQLGEIADEPAFKVRFFPLSLSRPAFSWFASLPHNSIEGWEDLETSFIITLILELWRRALQI